MRQPSGFDRLHDNTLNKSTAFTAEERERYGLRGLLPPAQCSQEVQVQRTLKNLRRKTDDIERFIYLQALEARNQRLFYRLVMDHVEEIMPLIYTPTVGQACLEFAHIFRQTKGLYVTARDAGEVASLIANWPEQDVRIAVVTDGERILGLGDLGANGMGIPIGKLALYTALAGISPTHTLPAMLDVGTDNSELRNDPLYLGLNQPRLRGRPYLELVDEFVDALFSRYPRCLLQFEDFATSNAFELLSTYQNKRLCFNDDIQGTAAVALAGILASTRVTGTPLTDLRIMFLGAGSAATGIGDLIVDALIAGGVPRSQAQHALWFVNSGGLVVDERRSELKPHNLPYAHEHPRCNFADAIDAIQPHVLIGATGTPGTFTRDVIEKIAANHERPVIFALSNPTSRAECTAEDAYRWTDGRALFASGSPFDPVVVNGVRHEPGQGNNAYIFPGLGLGALVAECTHLPTDIFLCAADALADQVTPADLERGRLYPPMSDIRRVSVALAVRVAERAHELGLAQRERPDDLSREVEAYLYDPTY